MFSAYMTLFRTPGAIKFSLPGIIGRMPVSMDSLALIFIVVAANGSYAIAGALGATASIVVAISMPLWARISDRIGQRAILIRVVPLKLFGLSLFLLLVLNDAPVWTWFLSIIFAEAVSINLGGMVRRRWLYILSPDETTKSGDKNDRHLINTAYSLEALNDEFVFITGPIIATACATSITPTAGLIVGMLFLAIGAPLFAIQRATEPPASPKREVDPHPAVIKNRKLQAVAITIRVTSCYLGRWKCDCSNYQWSYQVEGLSRSALSIFFDLSDAAEHSISLCAIDSSPCDRPLPQWLCDSSTHRQRLWCGRVGRPT